MFHFNKSIKSHITVFSIKYNAQNIQKDLIVNNHDNDNLYLNIEMILVVDDMLAL
jgi:hypothetical protein